MDPAAHVTVLTGAGISAESGIPTFRGPEGYWTRGSRVYTPQEIATNAMFRRDPPTVWHWYLNRLHACGDAQPNSGHRALVAMEQRLQDRFSLITQNIDNLHIRAGNSPRRTLQIHGNITLTRCAGDCRGDLLPLPGALLETAPDESGLNERQRGLLQCDSCGGWLRPHVLWFDEFYNEEWFRADSALHCADETDVLIIAGTSGATTLPNMIVASVIQRDKPIIDINIEPSPFSEPAAASPGGGFVQASCSKALPAIAEVLGEE